MRHRTSRAGSATIFFFAHRRAQHRALSLRRCFTSSSRRALTLPRDRGPFGSASRPVRAVVTLVFVVTIRWAVTFRVHARAANSVLGVSCASWLGSCILHVSSAGASSAGGWSDSRMARRARSRPCDVEPFSLTAQVNRSSRYERLGSRTHGQALGRADLDRYSR
jgi:hypothetical protein